MYAQERHKIILEILNKKQSVSVRELCSLLNTSATTIRNDLSILEKKDLLDRTHGGAINVFRSGFERITSDKVVKHKKEKEAIGKFASTLVQDGDVIAVDTSTTTIELIKNLRDKERLTIVTNDLVIATMVEHFPHVVLMFIGGIIRKGYNCAVGPQAIEALSDIWVDKAFIACNGFTVQYGISTPNSDMAQYKKKLIENSSQAIVLCDSSKIGHSSFIKVASIDELDHVVTDAEISKESYEEIEATGLRIDIAH
jgi:DeoR/GlpR family transcriptional regulator of sugar metabolism